MNNFKEKFKKWWWVALIALVVIGSMLPPNKGKSKKRSSSVSQTYFKWPCKYCGRHLKMDEVLTPNEGVYTAENGYVFCSQKCWHDFLNLGH